MKRFLYAVPGALIAYFPAAFLSVWITFWLYRINAPEAYRSVQAGWGLEMWIPELSGGVTGAMAAFGIISGRGILCAVLGGTGTVAMLIIPSYLGAANDWITYDLIAFPLLLSLGLCAWGLRLIRRNRTISAPAL